MANKYDYMIWGILIFLLLVAGLLLANNFITTPISGWFSGSCISNSSIGGCI